MIGDYMEKHGTKFARGMVPSKFEKTADGKVRVFVEDKEFGIYDTVLMAIGRSGCCNQLNLEAAGVEYKKENGKIHCTEEDGTNVPSIFAIGDVGEGRLELTPTAIKAGRLLAARLFNGAKKLMDYLDIATTVFTPLEYGTVGYSEEDAKKELGDARVKIYHTYAKPLEWNTSPARSDNNGYMKVICDTEKNEKVVGIHILGPNA